MSTLRWRAVAQVALEPDARQMALGAIVAADSAVYVEDVDRTVDALRGAGSP